LFGFSLTKLLFLVVMIVVVLYAFGAAGRRRTRTVKAARAGVRRGLRRKAIDVAECKLCGEFIQAGAKPTCRKKDCPQRTRN